MPTRILLLCNSNGGVFHRCLQHPWFCEHIVGVVSDRACGFTDLAAQSNIPAHFAYTSNNHDFSEKINDLARGEHATHLISCGFTRILQDPLLSNYRDRVFNSHFSLLPAFPGRHGTDWTTDRLPPRDIFRRALLYGARFTGNTIHSIDASIDGGQPILQSVLPVPFEPEATTLRHQLFRQEVRCILQLAKWLIDQRIKHNENQLIVDDVRFEPTGYSPNLDRDIAELDIT